MPKDNSKSSKSDKTKNVPGNFKAAMGGSTVIINDA